jgi:uncharacterized protein
MVMPRVADSLAGRMAVITMWPLSQGAIEGVEENFIDAVFQSDQSGIRLSFSNLAQDADDLCRIEADINTFHIER